MCRLIVKTKHGLKCREFPKTLSQTTSIRVIRVRIPLKSRKFFPVNSQFLKLLLPLERSYLHLKNRRLVSSVGRAPVRLAGGRWFKSRPDQHSGSLNN